MRISAIAMLPVVLAGLLAAAACTAVPNAPAPVSASQAAGVGTVLVVRPIAEALPQDGAAWRAALLSGAADSPGASPAAGTTLAEFIVREDTGATLSIVQPNAAGLHPGDRVTVIRPGASPGRASLGPLL
jgi:hypothetical protein